MSSAYLPLAAGVAAIRQWLVFPLRYSRSSNNLNSFELLVERSSGFLYFFEFKTRAPSINKAFVTSLVAAVDSLEGSPSIFAISQLKVMGIHHLNSLLLPFDKVDSWCELAALNELCLEITLQQALDQFLNALHPASVQSIQRSGNKLTTNIYHFMIGGTQSLVARNRRQAVAAFPLLVSALAGGRLESIRSVIDSGGKLVDALAEYFQVPKFLVRAVGRRSISSLGQRWATNPEFLFDVLSCLPVSTVPSAIEDWKKFYLAVDAFEEFSGDHPLAVMLKLWLPELAKQAFEFDHMFLCIAVHNAHEFVMRLSSILAWSLGEGSCSAACVARVHTVVAELQNCVGPQQFSDWEGVFVCLSHDIGCFAEVELEHLSKISWRDPLNGGFFSTDKCVIQCISDFESLSAEGIELNHCVATHASLCLRGETQIFSVRDLNNNRRSTLETYFYLNTEGSCVAKLIQHRAFGNAEPDRDCKEAEVSLMSYLNSNQTLLSSYLEWARDSRPKDKLTMTLLMRPAIAALDQILPEEYSFERLKALCMEMPEGVLDMKSINQDV